METLEQKFYTGKEEYLSIIFDRWRKFYIATMFFALLSSFLGCLSFVAFIEKFSPHCPLFSQMRIIGNKSKQGGYSIDLINTKWTQTAICDFVLYVSVINMLIALSGLLLFCCQSGLSNLIGGFSHNSQLKLVPPTCISTFLTAGLSFAAAILLTLGASNFCKNIEEVLESCSNVQFLHWDQNRQIGNFQMYLERAQVSYWLTTHLFLTHGVMTLMRWITNADNVIAEERELNENPIFDDITLRTMAENQETLTAVTLFARF